MLYRRICENYIKPVEGAVKVSLTELSWAHEGEARVLTNIGMVVVLIFSDEASKPDEVSILQSDNLLGLHGEQDGLHPGVLRAQHQHRLVCHIHKVCSLET